MQHNNELFFSNEPLPESDTTITLDIVSEEPAMRGIELARKKILEGKITLNPQSNHIYALPSMPGIAGQPLQTSNRTKWDFYLVTIPFTLHEAPGKNYYHEVTFFINLSTPNSTAFDIFPKSITLPIEKATTYTVASDMKIREVQDTAKLVNGLLRFDTLHPLIIAFGEGENNFYWTYRASRRQKGVLPETKHVLVLLRVPHGTKVVEGTISYEIVIAKHFLGEWYDTDSEVDPYPIHWELENAEPTFFSPQVQSQGQTMSTNKNPQVDICILCALAEEADNFKKAWKDSPHHVEFKRARNERLKRVYDYATLPNIDGTDLGVFVTWLPSYGPEETALQLRPMLEEFTPQFAAMTGICAGDKKKVTLGDIIVAKEAFLYDTGKVVIGEDGRQELQRDTQPWRPPIEVVHFVNGFNDWKDLVEQEPRPPSKLQQHDWLLSKLLEPKTQRVEDIPDAELAEHVPDLIKILQESQSDPDAYITNDRSLKDPARVRNLRFQRIFPFQDPRHPGLYVAPIASGNAVRADNPFKEIRLPVRDTIAVEMEGATFYRTLAEFNNIHSLLVKGVSDYADSNKDDTYRNYASKVSALYMLSFIREYVISSRFPALQGRTPKPSSPTTGTSTSTPPTTKEPQKGLQLFYSYDPAWKGRCWRKSL